jgi:hypothetical protein
MTSSRNEAQAKASAAVSVGGRAVVTQLEWVALAMTVATLALLYYQNWTSALRGVDVSGESLGFAPHVLLLMALVAGMRRTAGVIAILILLLLVAVVGVTNLFDLNGGGASGPETLAFLLQFPLAYSCFRAARQPAAGPNPHATMRLALGLAAGMIAWTVITVGLKHAG